MKMTEIKLLIEKKRQLILFGMVGVINTAVDYIFYSLFLTFTPLEVGSCQAVGFIAGLINSFIMNRLFTFKDGVTTKIESQIPRFLIVNGISLGLSIVCLELLVNNLGLNPYLAKIPITMLVLFINYFGYKLFVFKVKEMQEDY